ncbi:hypothetical protein [Jiella pelagia]|uniref:hypothetical protein n=1 Tax=Jiella pelagia TaxID=2986949 RepID=UPI0038B32768
MTDGDARTARAEQESGRSLDLGHPAAKALGKAPAVGVVAEPSPAAEHHGVHGADPACRGGEARRAAEGSRA